MKEEAPRVSGFTRGHVQLRFSNDEDLLLREPGLDDGRGAGFFPRTDRNGKEIRDWDVQHQLAMDELDRRLRSRKSTDQPFEIGRLGLRSQIRLRDAAASLALHYLFVGADSMGDENGFYARKAAHYWSNAQSVIDAEASMLEYDDDGSGEIGEQEKNQPIVSRFVRG